MPNVLHKTEDALSGIGDHRTLRIQQVEALFEFVEPGAGQEPDLHGSLVRTDTLTRGDASCSVCRSMR